MSSESPVPTLDLNMSLLGSPLEPSPDGNHRSAYVAGSADGGHGDGSTHFGTANGGSSAAATAAVTPASGSRHPRPGAKSGRGDRSRQSKRRRECRPTTPDDAADDGFLRGGAGGVGRGARDRPSREDGGCSGNDAGRPASSSADRPVPLGGARGEGIAPPAVAQALEEAKAMTRQMEACRDEVHMLSVRNAILLDSLAMAGVDV